MGDGTEAGQVMGRFCWPEANMKDPGKAEGFYTALFGWGLRKEADGSYAEWQQDGKSLGGLIGLGEREKMGVPPHWIAYVAVASCDETAAKVKEAGGTLLAEPFSMAGVGRFAAIQDPTGGNFALYQPEKPGETTLQGVPVSMCWNELMTRDTGKAAAFYEAVFGWTRQVMPMPTPSGEYTLFLHDGAMVAGAMEMQGENFEGVPTHWLTYFAVEDCDATAKKAAELGGEVCVEPTDIPNVGRFSVLLDDQGAVFAILKLSGPPAE